MLKRDDILKAKDIDIQTIRVPEWGGDVGVKGLTGTERDKFEQSILDGKKVNLNSVRAKLCAAVICDEKGKRLFTDADVLELGKKSAKALNRIFEKAQEMNGLGPDDVEDLAKNSGVGQSDDSISD